MRDVVIDFRAHYSIPVVPVHVTSRFAVATDDNDPAETTSTAETTSSTEATNNMHDHSTVTPNADSE